MSGIGKAKIPVQKGLPFFSVGVFDTGGMHCCQSVSVINPKTGKTVYDSDSYGLNGRVDLIDLDGDGSVEILQNITSFHEYEGTFSYSPWVDAVFAYDAKRGRYLPAMNRFPEFWRETLHEARSKRHPANPVPALVPTEGGIDFGKLQKLEGQAVGRAVNLILAGYGIEAYAWLERQYENSAEGQKAAKTLRRHMKWHQDLVEHKPTGKRQGK